MKGLLKVHVLSRVRVSMGSNVRCAEFVGTLASAPIELHGSRANPVAIGVERAEHAGLVLNHRRLDALQRLCGDEERPFHRGVVAPEAYRTPRCVVATAAVWKRQAHARTLRRSSYS